MTYKERMFEVLQQPTSAAAVYFNDEFGCPPLNDRYDDGCKQFSNCRECWEYWLKSEVKDD